MFLFHRVIFRLRNIVCIFSFLLRFLLCRRILRQQRFTIELRDDLVVILLVAIVMFVIRQEAVVDTCGKDDHLSIFAKGVIVTCTPNHLYVWIQPIHESIHLTHFTDEQRLVLARIDIEEDLLGIRDVTAVEQWRLKGIDNCLLHSPLTTSPADGHDGATAFTHRCFHIAEVKVNAALNRNQFRYTLCGIAQDIVRDFESVLDREFRVGIDIADALIINNE